MRLHFRPCGAFMVVLLLLAGCGGGGGSGDPGAAEGAVDTEANEKAQQFFEETRSDVRVLLDDAGHDAGRINERHGLIWVYEHGFARADADGLPAWGFETSFPRESLEPLLAVDDFEPDGIGTTPIALRRTSSSSSDQVVTITLTDCEICITISTRHTTRVRCWAFRTCRPARR